MRQAGRIIWTAAKLVFMMYFYLAAIRACTDAQQTAGIVTAMLEGSPLSAKEAAAVCAQEQEQESPQYVCFWGEQPDVTVSCQETGKSSEASVILTQGNPELVMAGTQAILWQTAGCYIDTAMAQELFGTAQAAGQILWVQEKPYTVCGTFESPERTMIRQAEQEDASCLDTVSLRTAQGTGTDAAEQFLMRNGLTGKWIEFSFLSTLAGDLLLILPVILAVGLIRFLIRSGLDVRLPEAEQPTLLRHRRTVGGRRIVCFALALAAAGAAVWLVANRLRIPADMIPTKWSDFSFWSDWWKEQRQNLLRILGSAQGEAQLMMLWNLLVSLLCNLLAVFAGISLVRLPAWKALPNQEEKK